MWPEEGTSTDANKYLGLLVFCLILIPSWIILFVFLYRRELQPIKGRLPMLSFLAQMCALAHETYLCFQLMYGYEIPCGLVILLPFITILPAVDFYLARGYILYFVFHVTQERLALACDALAHERERAASQSQSKSQSRLPSSEKEKDSTWEATQTKDSSSATATATATATAASGDRSRESTLKWFLRNRYRVQRPFLSACLVTVNFLQMIYPVIYAVSAGDRARVGRDEQENQTCGSGYGNLVLGIEVAILIVVAIWIAVKLRHIHDAFFLKDELRLVSAISLVGVVVWIILSNIPAVQNYDRSVFGLTALYLFFVEQSIFVLTIVIPLYHSFDPIMQCNDHDKNDADVEKLKQIIDIVPGFESFRAFVTREFSVQNLLFYVDVRDFRAKYDPNFVDANSRTKSHPTPPIAVVTAASPTAATAPPSPSLVPSSPHSTSRDVGPLRAASMIAATTTTTTTTTSTAAAAAATARPSSGATSQPRSSSTISTATSAILSTFHFGKNHKEKEKQKDEYTPQQLAEHNKRVLLTEANIQYEASRLFRKYIAFGAPLQVNLPDSIVTEAAQALGLNKDGSRARKKTERERGGGGGGDATLPTASFLSSTHTVPSKHHSVSTAPMPRQDDMEMNRIDIIVEPTPIHHDMFNEAQAVILRLMAVDSFKRYKKSSDYEDLSRLIESDPLMKMGLGRL